MEIHQSIWKFFYGLTINLVVRKVDFYNNLIFMTT